MITTIPTERLVLKHFGAEQAQDLFEIFGDAETMHFYDMFPLTSVEGVQEILDWKERIFKEGTGMRWGMFLEEKLAYLCGALSLPGESADHFIDFLVSEFLSEIGHDVPQLCSRYESVSISIKDFESFN